MAKKLICVWLSLTILIFSSISIYADETVQGDFFVKHVVINGNEILNYNLQYPFISYNNTTYFPLSLEMAEICGIDAEMDWESRTLKLLKTDSTRKNISSNWLKNNNEDISVEVLSGVKVFVYQDVATTDEVLDQTTSDETKPQSGTEEALEASKEEIIVPELNVREMDLGGLPILAKGKYLFIPIKPFDTDETFNWDIYFDPYYGICISTDPTIKAESYCNKTEVLYNKGLVAYMNNYNSSIKSSYGQYLVFLFQRAADVYGVDEKLLMAVAHKESTFNALAHARGGAVGMMQIMPSTGALFGLSLEQLYDAKTNIDFGAMYISERIKAYNGDSIKGLSAYNQGSIKVNRGSHSTAYATKILSANQGINNYLVTNGYVAQ